MGEDLTRGDLGRLTGNTQAIWDQNAAFWDDKMGEGNDFQRVLVGPATERLLQVQPGETMLDVACGNGVFARRLAALGAEVVACDFSAVFVECARARTTEHAERVEYRVVDATDEDQLLALGRRRFDAAVCGMALMDMTTIDPLMRRLRRLLKPGGRFVFSVTHPCFNTSGTTMVIEEEDREGELTTVYAVKVTRYLHLAPAKGLGIIGQPVPHYYFHRPLSVLFAAGFAAGFVVDGLEEPAFAGEAEAQRPFSWANYRDIPPVLVTRMRLMQPRSEEALEA